MNKIIVIVGGLLALPCWTLMFYYQSFSIFVLGCLLLMVSFYGIICDDYKKVMERK